MGPEQKRRIAVHRLASWAWGKAWDAARSEDARIGRRYDRRIYAEVAHAASQAVLDRYPHIHKEGRGCR